MGKTIASTILSALFSLCAAAEQLKPDAPEDIVKEVSPTLNKTFSDEFENGFDKSKWFDFYPTWNGRAGMFHFARKNVAVRDGMLILTARAEKPEDISEELKAEGKEKFSTAAFRSKTRIRYGYFETKFKAMNACVCNAFWLNDPLDPPQKYKPGNFIEEIDIFEVFGKSARKALKGLPTDEKIYFMTTHRAQTPYVESKVWLGREVIGKKMPVKESFANRYHTAGLLWTPEKLVWILDGKVVEERPNKYFNRPLYLNIDCEVMSGWMGYPNLSDLPAEYKIEYVRVWDLKNPQK